MSNILVVYHYYGQHPPRATKWAHLFCFRKYSGHRCFYLNLAFQGIPPYLKAVPFDLVIFHTLFFSLRWKRGAFERYSRKVRPLKQMNAVKIALPQDEFINTDLVCNFINEFSIDYVFSVAPESEWHKIYPTVDLRKVKFYNVLTGYLDDTTVSKINELAQSITTRTIDIGYRTGQSDPSLGRRGYLKGQVAEIVQAKAVLKNLTIDISNRPEDIFLGDEWYKFLLRCKYTLGVESGSSILDKDSTIRQGILAYVAAHPQADLDEIAAACFPNHDETLGLSVIAPRHLEACATKTCQVLVEGKYNGILIPGVHYIELKNDYSNIDQVLQVVQQDQHREAIVERAYRDVVESGRYSYRSFVTFVVQETLRDSGAEQPVHSASAREQAIYYWMRFTDVLRWAILALLSVCLRIMTRILPQEAIRFVKSSLVKWFL